MAEAVEDLDCGLGDLVQLQELLDELMTKEQQKLFMIGRGRGEKVTSARKTPSLMMECT
jgi:hypothetical protein